MGLLTINNQLFIINSLLVVTITIDTQKGPWIKGNIVIP